MDLVAPTAQAFGAQAVPGIYRAYEYDGENAREIQAAFDTYLRDSSGDEVLLVASINNDDGTPFLPAGSWYVIGPMATAELPRGDTIADLYTAERYAAAFQTAEG